MRKIYLTPFRFMLAYGEAINGSKPLVLFVLIFLVMKIFLIYGWGPLCCEKIVSGIVYVYGSPCISLSE